MAPDSSNFSRRANDLVMGLGRHWLLLFNSVWAVYLIIPFLAPLLMQMGWEPAARAVYSLYAFLCHQLPERSYFLFGPTLVPTEAELVAAGMSPLPNLFLQRTFIGSLELGWKTAICQRDIAIYLSVFLTGLFFAVLRRRMKPLAWQWYALACVPIAVDGLTQLVGWRESTWVLRSATGALFGMASVLLAYPFVEEGMQDVLVSEEYRRQRAEWQAQQAPEAMTPSTTTPPTFLPDSPSDDAGR